MRGHNLARPLKVTCTEPLSPIAMLSHVKQYLKLKRQATYLMLTGDLKRYMDTLRQMHELRARGMAA
jgi:hypothetical protein